VVPVNINGGGTYEADVSTVICPNTTISVGGYKISGYVYFDGPDFPAYTVFGAYPWAGTDVASVFQLFLIPLKGDGTGIPTKSWVHFGPLTFNSSKQADHLAIEVSLNSGSWNGTIYLDDITVTGL
jgi:hypothetical protein